MRSRQEYDRAILELASGTHSVVHARDLRRHDIPDYVVRNRVHSGFMAPVVGRSFAVGPECHNPNLVMCLMAATLAAGEDAVLDGAAAARQLGLWDRGCDVIQVTSPRNTMPRSTPRFRFVRARGIWLPEEHRTVDEIPVAGMSQIAATFATDHTHWMLAFLVDRAIHRGLVTLDRLREHADARSRAPGNATLRAALDLVESGSVGTRSETEDFALLDLISAGAPIPIVNTRGAMGMSRDEPDFVWRDRLRNIEMDGRHHEEPAQADDDRLRDTEAEANGWTVVRVRARDFWRHRRFVVRQMLRFVAGYPVETIPGTRILAVPR